jgi:hypothetical protein
MVIIQSSKKAGEIKLLATSPTLDSAWTIIQSEETKLRAAL